MGWGDWILGTFNFPTKEIIQRTFAIRVNEDCGSGSSLAYPAQDFYYLITAAHVLGDVPHKGKCTIQILHNNAWNSIEAVPYYYNGRPYSENDIDIVVIKTNIPVNQEENRLFLTSKNCFVGQDVFFLGFPYLGTSIKYTPKEINSGYPFPFVKKAALAAFDDPIIYLDGHNNHGFSGGPVVFYDYKENRHKILGVISAYLTHNGKVERIEAKTKNYEYFYQENSGIGIAYDIRYANELIAQIINNPAD